MADRAGLVIIGAFEIGTAEHTSLASDGWTPADGIPTNRAVQTVKARLARQLRASRHPVMVMWFVGNEGARHLSVWPLEFPAIPAVY